MNSDRPIGVAGAGSIGCFVGGMLAAAGHRVALLARPRVIGEIEACGLRLTGFDGLDRNIAADTLTLSDDPSVFRNAGVVLVTVKSADTAGMADAIASHTPDDAVIVSLQNGVGNVAILRERLAGRTVLGGMVPFNVVAIGEGRFHRSTSGDIYVEQDSAGTAAKLSVPELKIRASGNIAGVQWGKLIVNLNNALNALSGLPLREQLAQRPWRALFADQMVEGLTAIQSGGDFAGIADADPGRMDAAPAAAARRHLRPVARADDADRSAGALVDVGGFAARPPHRNRLSAGGRHRHFRPPWAQGAVVAPRRRTDQAGRGQRPGLARTDAGADPALTGRVP